MIPIDHVWLPASDSPRKDTARKSFLPPPPHPLRPCHAHFHVEDFLLLGIQHVKKREGRSSWSPGRLQDFLPLGSEVKVLLCVQR